ncbi:hypothetical protein JTB14_035071 [Gonioctena quinquepunctata]|nr:hypothetical protein JTB14_035071 [Gonioctena quinquepunctata]
MSAICCPPKYNIKKNSTLGKRYIAGEDDNAKHPSQGSSLKTLKCRELVKEMKTNNLQQISTYQPTYWQSDKNKIPEVIDFCITNGIDI